MELSKQGWALSLKVSLLCVHLINARVRWRIVPNDHVRNMDTRQGHWHRRVVSERLSVSPTFPEKT